MKTMKRTIGIILVALILTVGGVSATWFYSMGTAKGAEGQIPVISFPWEGAEELPNQAGEDHKQLIDTILSGVVTDGNGSTTNIGLNNPNSYLAQEIASRTSNWRFSSDTLGSMDYWESSDINKYFDLDTGELAFLLYFPEGAGDTYYLFTMTDNLGGQNDPNVPVGEYIYPVYRTTLEKDAEGNYQATMTEEGYAPSAYYSNPITGSIFVKYPSINPGSWRAGTRGDTTETAVYTFVGETQTAYLDTDTNIKYYKTEQLSARSVLRLSTTSTRSSLHIYDTNMKEVTLQTGEQGEREMTFVARANTTYYIVVVGDHYTTFTLETAS